MMTTQTTPQTAPQRTTHWAVLPAAAGHGFAVLNRTGYTAFDVLFMLTAGDASIPSPWARGTATKLANGAGVTVGRRLPDQYKRVDLNIYWSTGNGVERESVTIPVRRPAEPQG
jgi:hypothetical protein